MKWMTSASASSARAASTAVPHLILVERPITSAPEASIRSVTSKRRSRGTMGCEAAEHAPGVRPGAPAELERIAEALGGDERATHPLALQHGVGADGGAVDDRLEAARCHIVLARRAPP